MKWLTKRKIFIDCGCNVGSIIQDFINDKPKYFESRKDAKDFEFFGFDHMRHQNWDKLESIINVKFQECLVWDKNEYVDFSYKDYNVANNISKVSSNKRNKIFNSKVVQTIDLSEFIKNNFSKNDYIILKMDIEASEYVVLPHLIETGSIDYINELYVEFHLRYSQQNKKIHDNLLTFLKTKENLKFKEWH